MQDAKFLARQIQRLLNRFDGIVITSHFRFFGRGGLWPPWAVIHRPYSTARRFLKSFLSLLIVAQLVKNETQIEVCLRIVGIYPQRFFVGGESFLPVPLFR